MLNNKHSSKPPMCNQLVTVKKLRKLNLSDRIKELHYSCIENTKLSYGIPNNNPYTVI